MVAIDGWIVRKLFGLCRRTLPAASFSLVFSLQKTRVANCNFAFFQNLFIYCEFCFTKKSLDHFTLRK